MVVTFLMHPKFSACVGVMGRILTKCEKSNAFETTSITEAVELSSTYHSQHLNISK
jgi:hypothetical protein